MKREILLLIIPVVFFIQSCATGGKPAPGSEILVERRPQNPPLWISNWHKFIKNNTGEYIPFVGISREFSTEQDAERDALKNLVEKITKFLSDTVSVHYQGSEIVNSISSNVIDPRIIYKKLFKEQSGGVIRSIYPEDVYVEVYKKFNGEKWIRSYKIYILLKYPKREIEKYYKRIEEELNLKLQTMTELYNSGLKNIREGEIIEGIYSLSEALKIKSALGWYAEKRHIDIRGTIISTLSSIDIEPITKDSIYAGKNDQVKLGVRLALKKDREDIPVKSFTVKFESSVGKFSPFSCVTDNAGRAFTTFNIPSGFGGKVTVYSYPVLPDKLEMDLNKYFSDALEIFKTRKAVFTIIHKRKFALFKVTLKGDEISNELLDVMRTELGGWMKIVSFGNSEYYLTIDSQKNIKNTTYFGTTYVEIRYKVKVNIKNDRTGENLTKIFKADGIGGTPEIANVRAKVKIKNELIKFIQKLEYNLK